MYSMVNTFLTFNFVLFFAMYIFDIKKNVHCNVVSDFFSVKCAYLNEIKLLIGFT